MNASFLHNYLMLPLFLSIAMKWKPTFTYTSTYLAFKTNAWLHYSQATSCALSLGASNFHKLAPVSYRNMMCPPPVPTRHLGKNINEYSEENISNLYPPRRRSDVAPPTAIKINMSCDAHVVCPPSPHRL